MKNLLIIVVGAIVIIGGYFVLGQREKANTTTQSVEQDQSQVPIQSHRTYSVKVVSNAKNIQPSQETKLVYTIENERGELLKNFEVTHEKLMHFIVVRKDLQYFQHLHPDFNKETGEFSVAITFPTDGPYRLFSDFAPRRDGTIEPLPVTLNYDVEVGRMDNYKPVALVADTQSSKLAGTYLVDVAVNKPVAGANSAYTLTVKRNGQSVTNLEKYLGALGHSVLLKEDTLNYIHTHAMEGMGSGPAIMFHTTFPEPGLYKTFTQFQHEGKVQLVEYALSVSEPSTTQSETIEMDHSMMGH